MTTHELRQAYASAYIAQALVIEDSVSRTLDQFPGSADSAQAMLCLADQYRTLALELQGTQPVDVPDPDDSSRMVRLYADGSVQRLDQGHTNG